MCAAWPHRSQRLLDATIFWIAAREAEKTFGQDMPWQGALFRATYQTASALELAGLAMILAVPRLGLLWHTWHEPIKVRHALTNQAQAAILGPHGTLQTCLMK
jgi:hypothetical protein